MLIELLLRKCFEEFEYCRERKDEKEGSRGLGKEVNRRKGLSSGQSLSKE